jgi:hypothetical protein
LPWVLEHLGEVRIALSGAAVAVGCIMVKGARKGDRAQSGGCPARSTAARAGQVGRNLGDSPSPRRLETTLR